MVCYCSLIYSFALLDVAKVANIALTKGRMRLVMAIIARVLVQVKPIARNRIFLLAMVRVEPISL